MKIIKDISIITDKHPNLFDYLAGSVLTNGLIIVLFYFLDIFKSLEIIMIPLWCLSALFFSYLICRQTIDAYLIVGIKAALTFMILSILIIPAFINITFGLFIMLEICLLIGSIGGSYLVLISKRKQMIHFRKIGYLK